MPPRPYRLAAVTSHPVQYQAPMFRQLAAHARIDLTVVYGHDGGVAGYDDRDFGRRVVWDRPLLEGYRALFLRRLGAPAGACGRLLAEARVIGHLRRGRFDAVFIHSYGTSLSLLAYLGAWISRTPVLLRTESEMLRHRPAWVRALKQAALRPLLAATAGVLVIGRANRLFFEAHGVPRSRQFFTPYAVDNAYFQCERGRVQPSRSTLRRDRGWDADTVVVGFSGKLIPRKGVADLVDAVAVLQGEGIRMGLLLIGDGPDRAALEARVRGHGMARTVFAGFRNQSELAECYACLDIFALPSRFDPWGLVLNEAMLFGLPVLATGMVGASLDLVEEGQNGYRVDVGDVAGLADRLRTLARSPELRRAFGRRSEAVVERYSYGRCVDGVLEALEQVGRRA